MIHNLRVPLALITCLALMGSAAAADDSYCEQGIDWLTYSVLALTIGIVLHSLLYMLGALFSRPRVQGMARMGISEIAGLSVVIIFILMLQGMLCNATPSTFGIDFGNLKSISGLQLSGMGDPNDTPVLELARGYLQLLYTLGERLYKSILLQVVYAGSITSVKVHAGSTIGDIHPLGGLEPLLNLAPYMLSSVTILLMSISAQLHMLTFFQLKGLSFFFPLGILMRVIPATRTLGASLIALVFATNFVYPLLLTYNFYILANSTGVDESTINSYIYNAPPCDSNDDCNSMVCEKFNPEQEQKYCRPCVISGIPPGNDGGLCCSKVSEFEDGECTVSEAVRNSLDNDDEPMMKGGGIITTSRDYESMGLTNYVLAFGFLSLVSKGLEKIPAVGKVVTAASALFVAIFQIGAVLLTKFPLGFIMNPLVLLLGILRLNMDFLFVGFILPVIEFIVIIEFVRTLTSSMGEPIDFIQVFRVI